MISINDKANCTGCGACYSICPKKAITLKEDFSGFKYPTVNVDKCVNCNLCEKVCPEINTVCTDNSYAEPIVKAAWNLDNDIRVKSTSGGVFSAIALPKHHCHQKHHNTCQIPNNHPMKYLKHVAFS